MSAAAIRSGPDAPRAGGLAALALAPFEASLRQRGGDASASRPASAAQGGGRLVGYIGRAAEVGPRFGLALTRPDDVSEAFRLELLASPDKLRGVLR